MDNVFIPSHEVNPYTGLIGRTVRINEDSPKSWAVGCVGKIIGIAERDLTFDPLSQDFPCLIKLENMDISKPPFGKYNFYRSEFDLIDENETKSDPVNHPAHYTDGKYEVINFIESSGFNCDFYLANAVKYLSRAGKKDPNKKEEDIQKAIWYLERKKQFIEKSSVPLEPIPVEDYLQDKDLTDTPQGIAIELLTKGQYEMAIKVLKMK